MNLHLNYITDINGKPKSVIIPNKEWDILVNDYSKIKKKIEILTGIADAIAEVKEIMSGRKKAKTLKMFLDEL